MIKVCALEECGQPFSPAKHNQVYCSAECRQIATNARVMQRYYEDKDRKNGKERICSVRGCGSKLSRYNETDTCARCSAAKESLARVQIMEFIRYESD